MSELKPCPFCGCKDCQSWNPSNGQWFRVECTNCHARTQNFMPESAAINAWNTRTGDAK